MNEVAQVDEKVSTTGITGSASGKPSAIGLALRLVCVCVCMCAPADEYSQPSCITIRVLLEMPPEHQGHSTPTHHFLNQSVSSRPQCR